jgi:hypothetical protein
MKFQQLPLGARFEFEGQVYCKTGPMTASSEAGGQRMMPRWADLRVLDGLARPRPRQVPESLDADRVRAAFEVFVAELSELVEAERQPALAHARGRFLKTLGLGEAPDLDRVSPE